MATQTRENSTENGRGSASVFGSFRDNLAFLDAVMAGVEKHRQRMEAEENPSE